MLGNRWTLAEDELIKDGLTRGLSNKAIAEQLPGRTLGTLESHLTYMRLMRRLNNANLGRRRRIREPEISVVRPVIVAEPVADLDDLPEEQDHYAVKYSGRDLLLQQLIVVHGEPRYDLYPGSK